VPVEGHTSHVRAARLPGDTNVLYHNNGDGTFSDVTEKSWNSQTGPEIFHYGRFLRFRQRWLAEFYVAVDSQPSILFHNNHDGTFTDVAVVRDALTAKTATSRPGWRGSSRLRLRRLVRHLQDQLRRRHLQPLTTTTGTELLAM